MTTPDPAKEAQTDQWLALLREGHPELYARAAAVAGSHLSGLPVPCMKPSCRLLFDSLDDMGEHVYADEGHVEDFEV